MAVLLFRLNNVPEEEAEAVRGLLQDEGLEFYETQAGAFGIGVAGIWLKNDGDAPQARALLADFQAEHSERMRQEFRERQARGETERFVDRLRREPLKVLLYLLAAGVILYISVVPWLELLP